MRQRGQTFIAGQITGITDTQIQYKPVVGKQTEEWTYEIRDGQVLDIPNDIKFGSYYYIIGEDIGEQAQYYVWTEAHEVTRKQAVCLYDAHKSRQGATGSLYTPLPDHLLEGILQFGKPAFVIWKMACSDTGEEPTRSSYAAALLMYKSKLHKADQARIEEAQARKKREQAEAELLEF